MVLMLQRLQHWTVSFGAVWFMVLAGQPHMTLVGATMKSSKKVEQLK